MNTPHLPPTAPAPAPEPDALPTPPAPATESGVNYDHALVERREHPASLLAGLKSFLSRFSVRDWLVIGCVLALFGPMFHDLIKLWTLPEAPQSYALLVLPAAGLLAWMLRPRLEGLSPQPSAWGLTAVVFGLLLLLLGTLASALLASALGFVAVITGIVWTRYGGTITRRLLFPLAYLLAMVPLPSEVLNNLTFPLQRFSIQAASWLLRPFGDVRVDGTQLHVGEYTLDVIAPCSGLTIVLPLFVLAVYYLFMVQAPLWKKALLTALTFPVAMGTNAVRVALIGVVGESFGSHAANTFHDYSGLLTVVLGFVVLYLIAKEMQCHQLSDDLAL